MAKALQITYFFYVSLILTFLPAEEKWSYSADSMERIKIDNSDVRRLNNNVRFVKEDKILLTDYAIQYSNITDSLSVVNHIKLENSKILKIDNMLQHFARQHVVDFCFFIRSFRWESLTENDGRGCVYLDGWVMGSNYGIK